MPAKKNGNGNDKEKDNGGKELVETGGEQEFSALSQLDTFQDLVAQNIGAGGISAFELDRIQVPAGGATMWMVNTLEGEEAMKEVEGIIVHMTEPRSYWATSFEDGGGSAPDCSSNDGIMGAGKRFEDDDDEPHVCSSCQFAQFGSDDKGRGQACKATKSIFMLMKDTLLPVVLTLPPGSLMNAKKYFLRLLSHGRPVDSVVTSWKLDQEKNPDGIKYSKALPSSVKTLEPEEHIKVKQYAETIRPYLGGVAPVGGSSSE